MCGRERMIAATFAGTIIVVRIETPAAGRPVGDEPGQQAGTLAGAA